MAASSPAVISLRRVRVDDVKALSLSPIDDKTIGEAKALMSEVRAGGESALIAVAHRFGDLKSGRSLA